jgi:hypothetical protein
MPAKLFTLNGVPDDEAAEIRELLAANGIDYYETAEGNWGIAVAAIWLSDEGRLGEARALIDAYQKERLAGAREEYARLREEGRNRTVFDLIGENPIRFVGYLAAIAMVIYFSTKPFLDIGK